LSKTGKTGNTMPLDQLHEEERYQKIRGEMSFFDHISELRKHLLRSALAIAVGGIVAFMNKTFLFETLIFGPKNPDFITYRTMCYLSQSMGMGDTACFRPPEFHLITRELGEVLMQHLYVSFWIGLIIAFPYILFEIWRFVSPGLHEHEQKAAKGIIGICTFLFFLGVAFGYFIIAPFSISFLAGYTVEGLEVAPTLDSYVGYMTMFTLPTGLVFEMPVAAYFLAKIGILGPASMRAYRRHAIVVLLIVAAIITPPDVVSQTIVAIPLFALYEVSIMVADSVKRKRDKTLAAAENRLPKPVE
jgi:sec-independent protein translocase protein TatC